ncbi:hypothetical protein [Phenylobacterium montanum]|uniref:Uncharacterized protein n=1 Tax=Phenylobacterium montanum TaxID=2823693 RepID=A0A975FZM0_9CAUL|nr:hypothetical protein [Caulobacter sp. S6]QUD88385.1 hypothetical protein KCG34_00365 [Caulobacter sp. S6]
MHDFVRLLLLLGIIGSAATLIGASIAFWMDEPRRLTRIAWRVLGGQPDGLIIAQGRDCAAAFRVAADQILVMRDGGANALLYRLNALIGAELLVDDQVVARVARGEPRRTMDRSPKDAQQVVLSLLFDDPRHPEFVLDLWLPMDEFRRSARPPETMIKEARAWLGRAEAIMRRAQSRQMKVSDAIAESAGREPEPARPADEPRFKAKTVPPIDKIEPPAFDDECPFDIDDPAPTSEAKTEQLPLL